MAKAGIKVKARRDARRAAYDALPLGARTGRVRPGSLKKKGKPSATNRVSKKRR